MDLIWWSRKINWKLWASRTSSECCSDKGKVSGNHSDGEEALYLVTELCYGWQNSSHSLTIGNSLGTLPFGLWSPTLDTPAYGEWDRTGRAPVRATNSGSRFHYKMGRTWEEELLWLVCKMSAVPVSGQMMPSWVIPKQQDSINIKRLVWIAYKEILSWLKEESEALPQTLGFTLHGIWDFLSWAFLTSWNDASSLASKSTCAVVVGCFQTC